MRLFISYAHVNKAIVKDWIVNKLVAGGHNIWFDDRLIAGQDWKQQLGDVIQASDALVYCMTPESILSEWCQWELARAVDFGKPVIPVLLQARTNLPDQLKHLQYVDFSDGATGDAVARLMGGLQQLLPTQIPPAPQNPQGKPAQAVDQAQKVQSNRMMKLLRDPAGQAIIGILGIVITVIIAVITFNGDQSSDATPTVSISTPATPVFVALRNLDIRSGPGAEFSRIGVLGAEDSLDIRGITEDSLWYQVLLSDGTYGWVLAAESFGRFEGNRSVLHIVTPTPTQTPTHTPSYTPTDTTTPTSTNTPQPSEIPTKSATQTDSPANTVAPTHTPLQPNYTQTPENNTGEASDGSCPSQFGIEMVFVPSTTFMMGSEIGPSNERPVREVILDGFCIDIYEITNSQYSRCVNDNVCTPPARLSSRTINNYYESSLHGNFPVLNVTWQQAQTFCEYRSGRLPTEAEWELAAGFDSETNESYMFPWGNIDPDITRANFTARGINDSVEIGQHPNGMSYFGLNDMSGNVAEWTGDWYANYISSMTVNPTGSDSGEYKVVRGGSFDSEATQITTTYRDFQSPNVPSVTVGFRCVIKN